MIKIKVTNSEALLFKAQLDALTKLTCSIKYSFIYFWTNSINTNWNQNAAHMMQSCTVCYRGYYYFIFYFFAVAGPLLPFISPFSPCVLPKVNLFVSLVLLLDRVAVHFGSC